MTLLGASEADAIQQRVASALRRQGFVAGDRFAISAPSSADLLNVAMAALRMGVVPVVVNTSLLAHEQQLILDDAQPRLVCGARVAGADELSALCRPVEPAPARDAEAGPHAPLGRFPLARPMMYTSGTTGVPKGVWTGVLPAADAERLWNEEIELWRLTGSDRYLQLGPLYHSAPLRFAMCTLLSGGDVVIGGTFSASTAVDLIDTHRPSVTFAAPIHLQRVLAAAPGRRFDSFRLVAHAGAPCPAPLKASIIAAFPADSVWEFYGSTEAQFTVAGPEDHRRHPHSVGRARPDRELRIIDGVIWCRTPRWGRFEYWRDPIRTRDAWHTDDDGTEWCSVGDLGRLEDGFLHLDGRRTDLIISGGVNVYPLEIEQVLRHDDRIADVAVFGIEDPDWGQAVCAAVVVNPASRLTVADLELLATRQVAPYKRPKRWLIVEAIPTSSTGKVQRHRLGGLLGRR